MLLVVFKVPMRVGFLASQPAMAKLVREVHASPNAPVTPVQRAGIYTVWDVTVYDHAIMIRTNRSHEGGFARVTAEVGGPMYNPGDQGCLWGGLYWFSED